MVVIREHNIWVEPEFRFPISGNNMNVHAIFLSWKKEESVPTLSKYGGAHEFSGW